MRSYKKHKKKKLLYSLPVIAIMIAVVILAWPAKKLAQTTVPKPQPHSSANQISSFNKDQYPTDQANSLWAVVNKGRNLPSTYAPVNLVAPNVPLRQSASSSEMHVRSDTAAALESMFSAAKADGISLKLASGYRSYGLQQAVYTRYVAQSGQAAADTFSARPGHSEHQTGLAADIEPLDRTCEVEVCFENTPEGKWLAVNAHKYGFIIRYQKNTQDLTGYQYEPWHVRYVGVDLAQQIYTSGQTLELFFGLPTYTNYPPQSLVLKS